MRKDENLGLKQWDKLLSMKDEAFDMLKTNYPACNTLHLLHKLRIAQGQHPSDQDLQKDIIYIHDRERLYFQLQQLDEQPNTIAANVNKAEVPELEKNQEGSKDAISLDFSLPTTANEEVFERELQAGISELHFAFGMESEEKGTEPLENLIQAVQKPEKKKKATKAVKKKKAKESKKKPAPDSPQVITDFYQWLRVKQPLKGSTPMHQPNPDDVKIHQSTSSTKPKPAKMAPKSEAKQEVKLKGPDLEERMDLSDQLSGFLDQQIEKRKGRKTFRDKKADELAKESLKLNDALLTESYVRILLSQNKYNQAIIALERMMVLNPEKSSTFAGQINEIKRKL